MALCIIQSPCLAFSQISLQNINKSHIISVNAKDTLYFALTTENPNLRSMGRMVFFYLKSSDIYTSILSHSFEDSYTIDYLIDDFDHDGIKDVLTIDKDETSYSITIYRTNFIRHKYQVKTVFKKENLYLTHKDIPGSINGIFKVKRHKGIVESLLFFEGKRNGSISSFGVRYNRVKKRFEVIAD